MTIKVYSISGAPRGWRVLLGLAFKDLDYEVHYLQASKQEHKQSPFLDLNPRGTIPVIEFKGRHMKDSIGILAWLDRAFPAIPLFGSSEQEASQIWELTLESCDFLRSAIDDLLRPILVEGIELPQAGTGAYNRLVEAGEKVRSECQRLNRLLSNSQFLIGEKPSAAETVTFPEIRLLMRAMDRKPEHMKLAGWEGFDAEFPELSRWRDQIETLPGVQKTFPNHWN